jgi:hypothetical protein
MNPRSLVLPLLVAGCAGLTGCTTPPGLSAAASKPAATTEEATAAPRLPRADPPLFVSFSDKCAMSDKGSVESPAVAILLGTLLKPVLDTAVPAATGWLYDRGVQALATHNAKLNASSTAVTTSTLYNADDGKYAFGCITLVRGERGTRVDEANYLRQANGGTTQLVAGSSWAQSIAKDNLLALKLARAPEFYLELPLESKTAKAETDGAILDALPGLRADAKTPLSKERKELLAKRAERSMYRTIEPARLDYLASGAERVINGQKNVSVSLRMDVMDEKGEWKFLYEKTYDFGKLKVGSEKINVTSAGDDLFVAPSMRRTADGYRDPMPLRVTAVLTETDDNTDLARAMEMAFRDTSARKATVDAVAKAVVDKLEAKIDQKSGATAGGAK